MEIKDDGREWHGSISEQKLNELTTKYNARNWIICRIKKTTMIGHGAVFSVTFCGPLLISDVERLEACVAIGDPTCTSEAKRVNHWLNCKNAGKALFQAEYLRAQKVMPKAVKLLNPPAAPKP